MIQRVSGNVVAERGSDVVDEAQSIVTQIPIRLAPRNPAKHLREILRIAHNHRQQSSDCLMRLDDYMFAFNQLQLRHANFELLYVINTGGKANVPNCRTLGHTSLCGSPIEFHNGKDTATLCAFNPFKELGPRCPNELRNVEFVLLHGNPQKVEGDFCYRVTLDYSLEAYLKAYGVRFNEGVLDAVTWFRDEVNRRIGQ